jgi:hypothetical protein
MIMFIFRILILQLALCVPLLTNAAEPDLRTFKSTIKPILVQYCYQCHGPEGEASPNLSELDPDLFTGVDGETWHDALNRINEGKMPPAEGLPLPLAKRKRIVKWLTTEMDRATEARRSTGGKVVFRRLTKYEYNNTLRDLLGIEYDYTTNFPPESKSAAGFLNNGQVLSVSPIQIEYYLAAARSGLDKAIVSGGPPDVYEQHVEKSIKGARDNDLNGSLLDGQSQFIAGIPEFPRQGTISVTVRAYALIPEGQMIPQMEVNIGIRSDTLSPSERLGVVAVTGTKEQPQTFVLKGRIEDFPLPGANPKFPGIQIRVKNLTAKPDPKPKKGDAPLPSTEPRIVVQSVDFKGPIYDAWPPEHHRQILPDTDRNQSDYVSTVIRDFMRRAFRRPVIEEEVERIVSFYAKIAPQSDSFEDAIRESLALVLISPDFLYMAEPLANSARGTLSSHQLAVRLSYLLWSTMPDDRLFELANSGELSNDKVLASQVQRMLKDPRSWEFVSHFTSQWLDLSGLNRIAINPQYYPNFDESLKKYMADETLHFFGEILYHDLSALNLIQSEFVMLNAPLARHYEMNGPESYQFERIMLGPQDPRGGLLTQGSYLMINSDGEDSHPIKRAVWIRERLLDDPPAAPPPDVPDLESGDADFDSLSIQRQLELHREKESCNQCHKDIDPWGIPFENFDAIGKWRTEVNRVVGKGKMIRAKLVNTTTLPDGENVSGNMELQEYLVERQSARFAQALVTKTLTYALGRTLEWTDSKTVDKLTAQFISDDYNIRKLLVAIVQTKSFKTN